MSSTSWPEGTTSNSIEKLFVDLFDEFGIQQLIDVPTHEKGNTLDLCVVSYPAFIKNINVLSKNDICSSDHFGITFELTSRAKTKNMKRTIFDFKRADWENLNKDLNSVPWNHFIESCDPNEGWNFLRNTLHTLMEKYIPTITIKDQGRPPWFDSEILNLCKKKTGLHKKYKADKTPERYACFSECRKKLKLLIDEKWKQI